MEKDQIEEYAFNLAASLIKKAIIGDNAKENPNDKVIKRPHSRNHKKRKHSNKINTQLSIQDINKSSVEIQTETAAVSLEDELQKKDQIIFELQRELEATKKQLNELKSLSSTQENKIPSHDSAQNLSNVKERLGSLYDFQTSFSPENIIKTPENFEVKNLLLKTDAQISPDFNKCSIFTDGLKMNLSGYSELIDDGKNDKILEEKLAEITEFLDKSKKEFETLNAATGVSEHQNNQEVPKSPKTCEDTASNTVHRKSSLPWANTEKTSSSLEHSLKNLHKRPKTVERSYRPPTRDITPRIRPSQPPPISKRPKTHEHSLQKESPSDSIYEQKSLQGSRPTTYSAYKEQRSFSIALESKERKRRPRVRRINLIDEILFNHDQDKESWDQILTRFKEDPDLFSKVLKYDNPPKEKINSIENSPYKPLRSDRSSKSKISSRNHKPIKVKSALWAQQQPDSSKDLIIPPKQRKEVYSYAHRSYKPANIEVDWSKSALDNLACKGILEFNTEKDLNFLTGTEIDKILKNINHLTPEEKSSLQYRGLCTLEKLRTELLLPDHYSATSNAENLSEMLRKCSKLIRARALTLKVLSLLHKREDYLLNLMALEESNPDVNSNYKSLSSISEELIQALNFWKQLGLPFSTFIYLGEDYSTKVYEDNSNIRSLFPGLNVED
ncbi:unnamed protein product [Blepharisma stoltei]|uniref:Uncharacterized protein n=1 Tax=Blepharisma stoltei TaxID=1481888 RepID=A0AAU9KIQ1_9CILI|nr:unnamed protein product [Blepharisma stoltei]